MRRNFWDIAYTCIEFLFLFLIVFPKVDIFERKEVEEVFGLSVCVVLSLSVLFLVFVFVVRSRGWSI